jgi:hypothetical protein
VLRIPRFVLLAVVAEAGGKGVMTSCGEPFPDRRQRTPRWPWIALGLALAWEAMIRIPLVLNAPTHLDSDLAVDGLTLLEATQGRWRWHYPGTPYMGSLPVLLSLPPALIWGATPSTLVSGGIAAYGLLTLATFVLAWRSFGPAVAAWSLVPLAFASTGTLWLTGRITGGHILTAAWHAGAFAILHQALVRGGALWAAALGLFCGLGLYLDAMFVITLVGLVPATLIGGWAGRRGWHAAGCGLIAAGAFLAGLSLRELGRRLEPHDAYHEQFRLMVEPVVLWDHARLLGEQCVPRLILGHRLPRLEADPDPRGMAGPGPTSLNPDLHPASIALAILGLTLFFAAGVALIRTHGPAASRAVAWGLLGSAAAVAAGFVTSWNIYNSDNYRYLVTLLVPWAVGFGLLMHALGRRGSGGMAAAWLVSLLLAGLLTLDTARWYARFGWIDARGRPVRVPLRDPALDWLEAHPEVKTITGDYWDVYRLAILTGGRVRGRPLPVFPDRFPEWSRRAGEDASAVLLVRPTLVGQAALRDALAAGGRVVHQARGIAIVALPGR